MRTLLIKSGKRLLRPFYELAPESLKTFYREFRKEFPPKDRSQVVLYTDNPLLFPGYAPRRSLTSASGQTPYSVKVSLISTIRNEADSVREWLDSLVAQSRWPDEVVIVDGGSTDGTAEILQTLSQSFPIPLKFIEAPGANIARGRNLAIRHASHPVIACTDFHSVPDTRWLEYLIQPFELDGQVQLSAGYYRIANNSILERLSAHFFGLDRESFDPQEFLPSSRSIAMTKSFWARAGGYPEWLSDAGEDTLFDYQAKGQKARWAFVPEAFVSWNAPGSYQKLFLKYFRYAQGDGEVGTLAHHYWYKAVEVFWSVLSCSALLFLFIVGFLFLGPWTWLAVLGLTLWLGYRFVRDNLHKSAELGIPFFPYTLLHRVLGLIQMVGYGVGVAHRSQVRQRQIAFYQDQLRQILAEHPDRKGIIIYPPTHDWDFMFQRPHQMARALARRGYLYIYCTANEISDAVVGFQGIEPYLYLSHVPAETFSMLEKPIVILGSPWNRSFLPNFDRPQIVYDHYDDLAVSGGNQEDHETLLRQAYIVLTTSQVLLERVRLIRPDAILSPNGADWQHIQRSRPVPGELPPSDLQAILARDKPVVGYSGALAEWFDYKLLTRAAQARPDLEFVLIGVDYDGSLARSGVLDLANVHWLGLKSYDELFHYIWRFSLGVIPFKVNTITLATSPVKQFEYMACGLPVVATPLPECRRFPEVLIAEEPAQFARRLDEAIHLKEDSHYQAAIARIAQENTWDNRAAVLEGALQGGRGYSA